MGSNHILKSQQQPQQPQAPQAQLQSSSPDANPMKSYEELNIIGTGKQHNKHIIKPLFFCLK